MLITYNSNLRPSQSCLLDEKRICLPSGVKVGANEAQLKLVSCFTLLPLASEMKSSIFIGTGEIVF